jgi:hypothetical protein
LTPLDSTHLEIFLENFLSFSSFKLKFENTPDSSLVGFFVQLPVTGRTGPV